MITAGYLYDILYSKRIMNKNRLMKKSYNRVEYGLLRDQIKNCKENEMRVNIETERLIIRDPIVGDFDSIWEMRNDESVTKFTGGITKLSKDELYALHIKRCENIDSKPNEYSVMLKDSREYIGYCGFQYCDLLGGLEILYGYAKKYWGNRYAIEAAKAVLDFGINELKLKEIVAAVNYENAASDKVLINIGFEYLGDVKWPNQGLVKKYKMAKKSSEFSQ